MNEQKTNQLFVFKRIRSHASDYDKFELAKRVVVKEMPIFTKVCMNYHFKNSNSKEKDTILFCKIDEIFEMNFMTEECLVKYTFNSPLKRQPLYFVPNDEQDVFMIASPEDGLHLDLKRTDASTNKKGIETNINKNFNIGSI